MSTFTNPLNNIKIASPCPADWNAMIGDERKRYCGDCKLNVYNLSGMTQAEAQNLLINSEGRLCVRFYRRADGTVLTKDCPVGWAKLKNRTKVFVTAAASLLFSFFGAIGLQPLFDKSKDSDSSLPTTFFTQTPGQTLEETNSKPENNQNYFPITMGNVSVTNKKEYTLNRGGVSNLAEVGQMIEAKPKR